MALSLFCNDSSIDLRTPSLNPVHVYKVLCCLSRPQASPAALAGAVLAEVPQQLTEYMTNRGLAPLAAQVAGP